MEAQLSAEEVAALDREILRLRHENEQIELDNARLREKIVAMSNTLASRTRETQ